MFVLKFKPLSFHSQVKPMLNIARQEEEMKKKLEEMEKMAEELKKLEKIKKELEEQNVVLMEQKNDIYLQLQTNQVGKCA